MENYLYRKGIKGEKSLNLELLLKDSCNKMGIPIEDKQINQLIQYKNLLLEWNQKINLTAITEESEIIIKHFVDSISIIKHMNFSEKFSMIDVGTGAGFPGIPIKIMVPAVSLTLLDSLNKRILFLEQLIQKLELEQVCCIHGRAEDVGKDNFYREKYDYCVSRAVAPLSILSEYCLPFVKKNGFFISSKGPNVKEELQQAESAIQILGGKIRNISQIEIPNSDMIHSVITIEKIINTPLQYPRKPGKISKKPLL